jgi:nucleotide-binding universal stress UspA family protein
MTLLPKEISRIVTMLIPAHGADAVAKALERATRFGRFRASDVASIVAIGPAMPEAVEPGEQVVVVDLPSAEIRSFDAYRLKDLA